MIRREEAYDLLIGIDANDVNARAGKVGLDVEGGRASGAERDDCGCECCQANAMEHGSIIRVGAEVARVEGLNPLAVQAISVP